MWFGGRQAFVFVSESEVLLLRVGKSNSCVGRVGIRGLPDRLAADRCKAGALGFALLAVDRLVPPRAKEAEPLCSAFGFVGQGLSFHSRPLASINVHVHLRIQVGGGVEVESGYQWVASVRIGTFLEALVFGSARCTFSGSGRSPREMIFFLTIGFRTVLTVSVVPGEGTQWWVGWLRRVL